MWWTWRDPEDHDSTLAHIAIETEPCTFATVKVLVDAHPEVLNEKDNLGRTPLVQLIHSHVAYCAQAVPYFISLAPGDGDGGRVPGECLLEVVAGGDVVTTRLLLECGVDPNTTEDRNGWTATEYALYHATDDFATACLLVDALLEAGARPSREEGDLFPAYQDILRTLSASKEKIR